MNFLSLGHYFAFKKNFCIKFNRFLSYLDCGHYLTETQGVLRKRHQDSEQHPHERRVDFSKTQGLFSKLLRPKGYHEVTAARSILGDPD
jgi:hypothetical protein